MKNNEDQYGQPIYPDNNNMSNNSPNQGQQFGQQNNYANSQQPTYQQPQQPTYQPTQYPQQNISQPQQPSPNQNNQQYYQPNQQNQYNPNYQNQQNVPTTGGATASLVCGCIAILLYLVLFFKLAGLTSTLVLSIVAIVLGSKARKTGERGVATAGMVIGIIMCCLAALSIIPALVVIAAGASFIGAFM